MIATPEDLAGGGGTARGGDRAGRGGRRAGLRVPLRAAGLPGPAAPGRRGDGADRPDRRPRPVRAGRGAGDVEAVLHAASQDLPCLAEIGYRPRELFDTELAGRLLGYPRVALGTMLEEVLGFRLAKEHSAADWSIRPLPTEMLKYAALDVEVLTELRDALAGPARRRGQDRVGPAGVRRDRGRSPGAAAGRSVAAHLGHPQGAHPAFARRRPRALAGRATRWPVSADLSPRRVLSRPGDHRGGPGRGGQGAADRPPATRPDQRVPRAERPQVLGPLAGGGAARPRSSTRASCPRWPAPPRPAARRPRTAGRNATRPRRPGSRPAGRRSARSRPRTGCRPRTCSPRTRCAGWPGSRRLPRPRRRSPRP